MSEDLRSLLETLDPKARDDLRRVLIHNQANRDAISSQLLRYRDGHGDDWADIIDLLTMQSRGAVVFTPCLYTLTHAIIRVRSSLRWSRPAGRGRGF